jgi:hypothetical protein
MSYWIRVSACLTKFHAFAPGDAEVAVKRAYSNFANPTDGFEPDADAITHIDPFDMACFIAKNKLNIDEFRAVYRTLLSDLECADTARAVKGLKAGKGSVRESGAKYSDLKFTGKQIVAKKPAQPKETSGKKTQLPKSPKSGRRKA